MFVGRFAIVVLLLIACCYHGASSQSSLESRRVSYQLHSYNDLREWRPLWSKAVAVAGVVPWLKVDPYFITNLTYCQEQGAPASDDGCFILTHDDPSFSSPRRYNTTDQLLAWLGDVDNAPFFTALPPKSPKLSIALCFKLPLGVSACSNSSASAAWRSLVTDLFDKATALIATVPWLQNTLEFVLDGSASPGGKSSSCLNDLWRPWNATYIWTITSPPTFLEAAYLNDPSRGYDRLQVLNEPEFHLPDKNATLVAEAAPEYLRLFQSIDYAKFQNGTYPLLFWEPSDQPAIQAVVKAYADPEKPAPPAAGLRFAINIDPAQFQVYSASHGFNAKAPALSITAADTQIATALVPSLSAADQPSVATFYNSPSGAAVNYLIVQQGEAGATQTHSGQLSDSSPIAAELTSASQATVGTASEFIFLSDRLGNVLGLDCLSSPIFSPTAAFTLPVPSGAVAPISYSTTTTAATANSGASQVLLFQAAVDSANTLFFITYSLSESQGSWGISVLESGSIPPPSAFGQITSLSISLAYSPASNSYQGLILAGNKAARPSVFIFSVEYMPGLFISLGPAPSYLPGEQPSVSVLLDPCTGELAFLAAVGESYCFNSETHNKRASVAVCDQEPETTPRILNYYFGRLSSLLSTVGLLTPCTATIVSGAYDQGNMPSVLLLPNKPALSNSFVPCLSVFEAHQTAFDMDAPLTTKECGLASTGNVNSLIFDSWVLAYAIDS